MPLFFQSALQNPYSFTDRTDTDRKAQTRASCPHSVPPLIPKSSTQAFQSVRLIPLWLDTGTGTFFVTCILNKIYRVHPTTVPNPRVSNLACMAAFLTTCLLASGKATLLPGSGSVKADVLSGRASVAFVADNTSAGPRSWLDPLRESRKQRTAAKVTNTDDSEFDLSEFSQPPERAEGDSVANADPASERYLVSNAAGTCRAHEFSRF